MSDNDSDIQDPYEDYLDDLEEYELDEDDITSFQNAESPLEISQVKGACCLLCDKYDEGLKIINDAPMSYHKRSIKCLLHSMKEKSVECQINSIRNSAITSLYIKRNELLDMDSSIHFSDTFLRIRHENLFSRLCLTLGLDSEKSDVKFSSLLPIESNRTPDWIRLDQKNVTIIEVTVTTNLDRAAKSKGIESMGYSSKYTPEISELKAKGYTVNYIVVVFNSIDLSDTSYKNTINEIGLILNVEPNKVEISQLESLRKEFCKLSRMFYANFADCLSRLFRKELGIKNDRSSEVIKILDGSHKDHSGSYKLINISPILFDTILRNWSRMIRVLESFYDEEDQGLLSIPIYDHATSRFNFRTSPDGRDYNEWLSCIVNDNKALFCRHIKIYYKSEEVKDRKSGFEFFYYEPNLKVVDKFDVVYRESTDPLVFTHQNSVIANDSDDIECVHEYNLGYDVTTELSSKYEDPDYEAKIINAYKNVSSKWEDQASLKNWCKDMSVDLLAAKVLNTNMIDNAINKYNLKNKEINMSTLGDKISFPYCKTPTIFPINITYPDSYSSYNVRPAILDSFLTKADLGDYTNKIISSISAINFVWGSKPKELDPELENIKKQIKDLQGKSLTMQKEETKLRGCKTFVKLKDVAGGTEISSELSSLYIKFRKLKKEKGGDKSISTVRLRTSGSAMLKNSFKSEMEHFKKKDQRSHYKGVGLDLDFNNVKKIMEELSEFMLSPSTTICKDEILDNAMGDDIPLLKNLKQDYIKGYSPYYSWLKSTNMYHACAFISRICHTLLFYSQSSLSSAYIAVDNLGYSDCLLICKGGKKIFPTKKSKMFRIVYPTSTPYEKLLFPPGFECSSKLITHMGRKYVVSPWQLWHETHLTDGLSYLSKLMGFCLLSMIPERSHFENAKSCLFNIILAFHARRQTEAMLHNLRYIMVNCLGDLTAIDDMLPDFAGFNYDCFQFYLRECITHNFKCYYEKCKMLVDRVVKEGWSNGLENCNLPHLFSDNKIKNSDDFARSIYSTYLMPKAPITQSLEQVSNLKSMLETHGCFIKESSDDLSQRHKVNYITLNDYGPEEYFSKMFDSDFNFDPSYMVLLGRMMSDYMKDKFTKSEMSVSWDKIISQSWDKMANSSGLRGDGEDFFGRKGYYVVYDDVFSSGKIDSLLKELSKPNIDEKKIQKLNETFSDKIKSESLDQIVFHVVDKVQRGGKREIFVMDKMTKVHQQPIESFMAEISKRCPSEMISIPSNKRLHTIHSRVFESKHDTGNQSYYWVMDCRKWAPRSMLEKFIYFLSGMKGILPASFIKHCYNFFNMMLDKQVHTRPHIIEIIKKSEANKWIDFNWLVADSNKKSVYYKMSYSWMMGIFNYFSSLIHVANQLHASHVIQTINMSIYNDFVTLTPIAHSDDSAAKFSSPNIMCTQRSIAMYELLLKSANHMLSKKKCNVGRVYFEFISILYLGSQLLPLLPKFLGQFSFQPTDGGYCTDVNDAYSKCINLIQNGATFQQAYISLKIQSSLIWRFYFGLSRKPNYNLPTQLYGSVDSHPLIVLLAGSDSDILRLYMTKGEGYLNKLSFINGYLNPNKDLGISLFHPITASPDIRPNKVIRSHIELIPECMVDNVDWSITNVDFKNTAFNALQYLLKLRNKSFCASLQDDTLTRRISRSYYFRESAIINTNVGRMKQTDLITLITAASMSDDIELLKALGIPDPEEMSGALFLEFSKEGKFSKVVNLIYSEVLKLMHYWSKMSYKDENFYNQRKTTKPIHISLQKTIESLNVKFDPSNLTSWIKEPKYRNILSNSVGYQLAESEFEILLSDFGLNTEEVDPGEIFHILNKFKAKTFSNIYCYGNVPSGLREINTYQDITLYLAHNSFEDKYIKGLTLPLGRTINIASQTIMPELRMEEVQYTCAILNIIISCECTLSKKSFLDFITLDVKTPYFITGHENASCKMRELPSLLNKHWRRDNRLYGYLKTMILIARQNVEGESINPDIFEDSFFYCFLRRQFLVVDSWMGKGLIYVSLGKESVVLEIDGPRLVGLVLRSTEMDLNKPQINYLNFVLHSCEISLLNDHMIDITSDILDRSRFGVGHDGVYRVSTGRNLIKCIPNLKIDPNLATRLSNFNIFKVRMKRRMKAELYSSDEIFGDNRFILNLFIIDPEKSLEVGRAMLEKTLNNEKILLKWNKDEDAYLLDILSQSLDIDLYVNHLEVYNHYQYTKLYKIMNYMQVKDKATISKNKLRKNMYPAQEGGLLDVLIKYQIETSDLDFNWNRVVTPELMHMKSTQPEAFMSNLMVNIKEKYDSLYDLEDKEMMFKDLDALLKSSGDGNDKLINILMMWGFVGVSGSVSEMSRMQISANYQVFRDYPSEFKLIKEFSNCYIHFLHSLFEVYIEEFSEIGNSFQPLCDKSYFGHGSDQVKETLISLIMSITCFLFGENKSRHLYLTASDVIIYEILSSITQSQMLTNVFKGKLSSNYLLCTVPIDKEDLTELFRLYRSLQHCYIRVNTFGEVLNNNDKVNRKNIHSVNIKAKELASQLGINFNVRRVHYNGLIPVKLYDRLNRSYQKDKDGKNIRVALRIIDHSDIKMVNFCPNFNFKYKLSEDFTESDEFEEINYELAGIEPDIDEVESQISEYGEDVYREDNIMKIIINSKMTEHYKVPVLNYIGKNVDMTYCKKYLQAGNDVVIITTSLYTPLFVSEIKFHLFHFNKRDWHDKSLLNPEHIFAIVISKHIKNVNFWCEILDATPIDKDWVVGLNFTYKLSIGRTKDNKLVDDYNVFYGDPNDNERIMDRQLTWSLNEPEDEDDGTEEPSHVLETDEIVDKLVSCGIEQENAEKYSDTLKEAKQEGTNVEKIFQKMFSLILKNKTSFEKIMNMQNNIIGSPLTEDQVLKIFQVPSVFGQKINRDSSIRNNALKDKELIAEIDSLSGSQTSKLIAGLLTITPKMYNRAKTCLSMCRKLITLSQKDKDKKTFLLDFATLFLNDAKVTVDSPSNEDWSDFISIINTYIDWDDDYSEDVDIYSTAPDTTGRVGYRLFGER